MTKSLSLSFGVCSHLVLIARRSSFNVLDWLWITRWFISHSSPITDNVIGYVNLIISIPTCSAGSSWSMGELLMSFCFDRKTVFKNNQFFHPFIAALTRLHLSPTPRTYSPEQCEFLSFCRPSLFHAVCLSRAISSLCYSQHVLVCPRFIHELFDEERGRESRRCVVGPDAQWDFVAIFSSPSWPIIFHKSIRTWQFTVFILDFLNLLGLILIPLNCFLIELSGSRRVFSPFVSKSWTNSLLCRLFVAPLPFKAVFPS